MKADRKKVEPLLRTARGQIDGVLKMIEDNRYCMDISNQLLATQAILRKANRTVVQAHLAGCVRQAFAQQDVGEQEKKIEEIVNLIAKMAK